MSSQPAYHTHLGPVGDSHLNTFGFNEAVRIPLGTGALLRISGQVGRNLQTNVLPASATDQAREAFDNVLTALKLADERVTWEHVVSVRTYHVAPGEEDYTWVKSGINELSRMRGGRADGHKPLWTTVAVDKLALPEVLVELEAEAWIPA